eukprot:TRINITY_DN180021_c0_g1_i1.p1 TRINITY_DN180021_c0_g1~~TRINITY_DN180021_c0_g1_i1.p1  ORF type:complete len:192 (-),score=16.33 TRINITY_DN180021_c0_g1_i1:87-662(-)
MTHPLVKKCYLLCDQIDEYAAKNTWMREACGRTGLKAHILAIGVAFSLLAFLLFGIGGNLICNLVGFLYPAWQSFRAIESSNAEDDKLWLTYWVVYGFFSLVEVFGDYILFWVPFYWMLKLIFLVYLFLPQTKGAIQMYNQFIRPFLMKNEKRIEDTIKRVGGKANELASTAQQLAGAAKTAADTGSGKSD